MSEYTFSKRFELSNIMVITMITASCGVSGSHIPKVESVVPVPSQYSQTSVGAEPLDNWCSDFADPQLDLLVEKALLGNLDLAQAWARLEQSEAIARSAGAGLYPSLDASAGVNQGKAQGFQGTNTTTNYSGSLTASYEVDLWGRVRANRKSADYDRLASRADAEGAALSLTTNVADAYFDVLYNRQRLALTQSQVDVNERYVGLLMARQAEGLASALDINQQQQQVESARSRLPQIEGAVVLSNQRLSLLLGRPPGEEHAGEGARLPALPTAPATGLPADLLTRRPDVRSAGLRLKAADRKISSAMAERLPALRLSASLSLQAAELGKLVDTVFWSIAGQVSQSLFDGGRRSAEVDRTTARAEELLYRYAQTLLAAMGDVESALVNERQQGLRLERLTTRSEHAEEGLSLARERYREGSADYLRVLTALTSVQQTEQEVLDAKRQQLTFRLNTCRALGGDWTQSLSPNQPSLEQR